jgi:hypothetical protein
VDYYRQRASYLESRTAEEFLESMGYYGVQPEDNGGANPKSGDTE